MTEHHRHTLAEHLPALLRFARSLTREPSGADDLVQDTVVRALERQHQFDGNRSYRVWLLTLTYNLFVDQWRRNRARTCAQFELEARATACAMPSQEHAAILSETLRSFETLPQEQRAVLHVIVVEGSSYAEAAEILGVPIGTIMSRLSRARRALRNTGPVSAPSHLRLVSDRDA